MVVTREGDVLGRSRGVGTTERARMGMVAAMLSFFRLRAVTNETFRSVGFRRPYRGTLQGTPEFKCGATRLPFWGGGVPVCQRTDAYIIKLYIYI